ncbi:MAG: DUF945 domain-containing protein, partial [Bacteroidia bacterium]|nr:DUF945 domain-containing protein [Bacteroidia bacterium]
MRTLYNPVGTPLTRQRRRLSDEEMRRRCTPMFAEKPFHEVSDQYDFIPTYRIVDEVEKLGFVPVEVRASYVKKSGNKEGFQGHQVRLMHVDDLDKPQQVGVPIKEIVLSNSHDRSETFNCTGGLFNPICANGLTVPLADIGG